MQTTRDWWVVIVGALIWAATQVPAGAQSPSKKPTTPAMPSNPAAWVNSPPITNTALQGKAAVLWFFEEDCPRCKEKWPGLMEVSKKYEGKPVVFIGVNSGTARPELEAYLREVGCAWPTICDTTREYEKACGVGEISLMNIHQMRIITSDGELRDGNWQDLEGTVERALSGAKWTVDPVGMPAALRTAWSCIEFGNCSAAAAPVKKALASAKPDVKEAAGKLNAAVQAKISQLLEEARQAETADKKWGAYKLYQQITENFAGYDLPPEVATAKKTLSSDDAIKQQLAAAKNLETIQKSLRSGNAAAQRTAGAKLKKLIQDSPGTEAAEEAQVMLDQIAK